MREKMLSTLIDCSHYWADSRYGLEIWAHINVILKFQKLMRKPEATLGKRSEKRAYDTKRLSVILKTFWIHRVQNLHQKYFWLAASLHSSRCKKKCGKTKKYQSVNQIKRRFSIFIHIIKMYRRHSADHAERHLWLNLESYRTQKNLIWYRIY